MVRSVVTFELFFFCTIPVILYLTRRIAPFRFSQWKSYQRFSIQVKHQVIQLKSSVFCLSRVLVML